MTKKLHVLLPPGFADWEPALLLSEMRRSGGYETVTIGLGDEPIISMGGLKVQPDVSLDSVEQESIEKLILIGGTIWEEEELPEVTAFLKRMYNRGVLLGAICGSTIAMARAGILDHVTHTSNAPGYLEMSVPSYAGAEHYDTAICVRDGNIITASGAGYVEFAKEYLIAANALSAGDAETWYGLFKHGTLPPEYQ